MIEAVGSYLSVEAPGRRADGQVHFVVDPIEHSRRTAEGCGAVTGYRVLADLLEVKSMTRELDVPVLPVRIDVTAATWRQGLKKAATFAGLASRTVHVHSLGRDADLAALEYMWFGVGLTVDTESGPEVIVEAAPFEPERFTATAWQFAEQVYGAWLTARASAEEPSQ